MTLWKSEGREQNSNIPNGSQTKHTVIESPCNNLFFLLSGAFEKDEEATEFVKCKIESLVANVVTDKLKEG